MLGGLGVVVAKHVDFPADSWNHEACSFLLPSRFVVLGGLGVVVLIHLCPRDITMANNFKQSCSGLETSVNEGSVALNFSFIWNGNERKHNFVFQ